MLDPMDYSSPVGA